MRLGTNKTLTTFLYPQLDSIVERYVNAVDEHLRMVASTHQRDWHERRPIFLLAYRASTYETIGTTPASMVFGREIRLPCDLFRAPPMVYDRLRVDLFDRLHANHHYARRRLKATSERMETCHDCVTNSPGFLEGDNAWVYRPTRTR
jgi:hypothetical protein